MQNSFPQTVRNLKIFPLSSQKFSQTLGFFNHFSILDVLDSWIFGKYIKKLFRLVTSYLISLIESHHVFGMYVYIIL